MHTSSIFTQENESVKVCENSHSMKKLLVSLVLKSFFFQGMEEKSSKWRVIFPLKICSRDSLTKKHKALGGGEVRI